MNHIPDTKKMMIKLTVQYPTTEKEWHSPSVYSPIYKAVELEPVAIIRSPCGRGAASSRYRYSAICGAPDDASLTHDGCITASIDRKLNAHFNPKNYQFTENICKLNKGECPHCNKQYQEGTQEAEFIGWNGYCAKCELKDGE